MGEVDRSMHHRKYLFFFPPSFGLWNEQSDILKSEKALAVPRHISGREEPGTAQEGSEARSKREGDQNS